MLLFTHPLLINKAAFWSFIFMGIPLKEHTTFDPIKVHRLFHNGQ